MVDMTKKTCFVISPIGGEGSEIRKRMDLTFNQIIKPVVEDAGYETPIRADHIWESGLITSQIANKLLNSDLVIADLSYQNPNVYYELAIRHVVDKPVIHMISPIDAFIPFDISVMRTIKYDIDMVSGFKAKSSLEEMIKRIDETISTNPIKEVISLQILRERLESKKQTGPSGSVNDILLETIIDVKESMDSLRNEFLALKSMNASYVIQGRRSSGSAYGLHNLKIQLKSIEDNIQAIAGGLDLMKRAGDSKEEIRQAEDKLKALHLRKEDILDQINAVAVLEAR